MNVPPIVSEGYKDKGVFEDIGGIKSYVVSVAPQPKTGILLIYDIFGFSSQIKQGADILAATDPGHVVVMPDFFKGSPMDTKNYPPDTDEKKKLIGDFFKGPAAPPKNVELAGEIMQALKKSEKFSTVEKWAVVGFCWGGKVATQLAIQTDYFISSAQCHPAMLETKDIAALKIPHLLLASKEEDKETVNECGRILGEKGDKSNSERYSDMIHGWMAARANLENGDERSGFEEGYKDLVSFFARTLKV